jgi:hypothetical protein
MKLNLSIQIDVEDADDDVAEQVASIAEEEGRKYVAALTDRLEEEGVTGVQIDLK